MCLYIVFLQLRVFYRMFFLSTFTLSPYFREKPLLFMEKNSSEQVFILKTLTYALLPVNNFYEL